MEKYRVCVIGCGVICESHLSALAKNESAEIAAVCDIRPERAKRIGEKYGCPYYTDYKAMINEIKPYSAHICLPHFLHSEAAVWCLSRGVRVLCEKPMNSNLAGAERMREASLRYGVPLGVIFQNRYNSGSVMAKAVIDSGRAGKVKSITGQVMWNRDQAYYDQDPWRCNWESSGGGVCVNQAIHTLDLMRWLSPGNEAITVKATASHHGQTSVEVEDTAEGLIIFENGVRLLFYFTINNLADDAVKVCVNCEKAKLYIEGGFCRAVYDDGTTETEADYHLKDGAPTGAKAVYGSGHDLQIAEFYADPTGSAALATMEEALKTQRLLHEIYVNSGAAPERFV